MRKPTSPVLKDARRPNDDPPAPSASGPNIRDIAAVERGLIDQQSGLRRLRGTVDFDRDAVRTPSRD